MLRIKKGENALITRFLKNKDKTDFNLTSFSALTVSLIQNGRVLTTYTYPSTYLRAGAAANELELEVTTAISDTFKGGKVLAKYDFVVPDAEFAEASTYKDIITEEILLVEVNP